MPPASSNATARGGQRKGAAASASQGATGISIKDLLKKPSTNMENEGVMSRGGKAPRGSGLLRRLPELESARSRRGARACPMFRATVLCLRFLVLCRAWRWRRHRPQRWHGSTSLSTESRHVASHVTPLPPSVTSTLLTPRAHNVYLHYSWILPTGLPFTPYTPDGFTTLSP